jgi:hypothetical protein
MTFNLLKITAGLTSCGTPFLKSLEPYDKTNE